MPIEVDELIAKMEWAAKRGLSAVTLNASGAQIKIRRESAPQQSPNSASQLETSTPLPNEALSVAEDDNSQFILAPMTGICYFKAENDGEQFVKIGDKVKNGQTVCIIEAMKVMTSITADISGTIEEVFVEDGASVEADTPLMKVQL